MANENDKQGGGEGRDSEFDSQKKDEFGKSTQGSGGQQSQQPESGQQSQSGGQQGQQSESGQQGGQSETGQQGQAGTSTTDRSGEQDSSGGGGDGGFVGSQGEESGEYLQEKDPQQAGFAEQGRGAPDEGGDIEGGGERSANRDSDIEGSSGNR